MPVGTILAYTGSLADLPRGWRLCDGTDGTPDLRGRFLQSYNDTKYTVGNYIEPGLPNITGEINLDSGYYAVTGAFYNSGRRVGGAGSSGSAYLAVLDASRSSSIYRNDINTVQPPAYTVYYIIKIK